MNIRSILESSGQKNLDEHQSKQLFKTYQIPVVEEHLVTTEDQAVTAARALGYPVVLKGMDPSWQHKTEAGLVCLNLKDAVAVQDAVRHIQKIAGSELDGIVVQPLLSGHRELMAGLFRDPHFGPVVLLGLGGTLAEALNDVAMAIAPLQMEDALAMIRRLKAQKLLSPFRGEDEVDHEVLAQVLLALSRMAEEHPEISEIDINPLKVSPKGGICAVDGLVVIRPSRLRPPPSLRISPETIGRIFYPRSIAFVGASAQIGKWGHMLPVNTIGGGYEGDVYLVNPKGGRILGRTVYTSIEEIPGQVDLAVVTIPAAAVPALIPQLQNKNIRQMRVVQPSPFAASGWRCHAVTLAGYDGSQRNGYIVRVLHTSPLPVTRYP